MHGAAPVSWTTGGTGVDGERHATSHRKAVNAYRIESESQKLDVVILIFAPVMLAQVRHTV